MPHRSCRATGTRGRAARRPTGPYGPWTATRSPRGARSRPCRPPRRAGRRCPGAGCAWRRPRGSPRSLPRASLRRGCVPCCPAFPEFELAGRTLREGPVSAIHRTTHWSTHSRPAGVLIDARATLSGSPGGDLTTVAQPELGQDVLDVVLGRPFGDVQVLADLLVRQSPPDQPGHLELAG